MFNPLISLIGFFRAPPSKEELKQIRKNIVSDFDSALDSIDKLVPKIVPNYPNLTKERKRLRKQKQKSQKINKK